MRTRLSVLPACAVAIALLHASACGSPAPAPAASTTPPPGPPPAIHGPHLYVTDETGGHVVVINSESGEVAGRYSVGKRPRGLRLSQDGAQLFVALSGSPIAGPGVDNS